MHPTTHCPQTHVGQHPGGQTELSPPSPDVPDGSICWMLEHQQLLVGMAWARNTAFGRCYGDSGEKRRRRELCGGAGWCHGPSERAGLWDTSLHFFAALSQRDPSPGTSPAPAEQWYHSQGGG